MIERGQPLHAFDYERLARPAIVVRRAGETRASARSTAWSVRSSRRSADYDRCASHCDRRRHGRCGKRGRRSARPPCCSSPRASIPPASAARRVASSLRSEASFRFERRVDIDGVPAALDRAAVLLKQLGGSAVEVAPGVVEAYARTPPAPPIHVRPKRVEELLGIECSRGTVIGTLKALGAAVTAAPQGALAVVPPTYRSDLTREIDLIEEVARVVGYEHIPATMPAVASRRRFRPRRACGWEHELKRVLTAYGFFEAITLSFTSDPHQYAAPRHRRRRPCGERGQSDESRRARAAPQPARRLAVDLARQPQPGRERTVGILERRRCSGRPTRRARRRAWPASWPASCRGSVSGSARRGGLR